MHRYLTLLLTLFTLGGGVTLAAGPESVARSNRSLWSQPINTETGFNTASRAEILAFGHALSTTEKLTDADWRTRLHLQQINRASIDRIRMLYWQRSAQNYARAAATCPQPCAYYEPMAADGSVQGFRQVATTFRHMDNSSITPSGDEAWFANAVAFYTTYIDEQMRLAALFPRISSEIDTFNTQEITGASLPDKQFFLTFDDGPSAANGNTDKLLSQLRGAGRNATFFVLGNALEARAQTTPDMEKLFAGMCVGTHGQEHKSHANWVQWQDSVTRSTSSIQHTAPQAYAPLFRPPYGQRQAGSGPFFARQGMRVALWNIDSQDWNNSISGSEAGQRVLSLMLLWRRGIILFHDIHAKAQSAVPYLFSQMQGSGVTWADCHDLQVAPH